MAKVEETTDAAEAKASTKVDEAAAAAKVETAEKVDAVSEKLGVDAPPVSMEAIDQAAELTKGKVSEGGAATTDKVRRSSARRSSRSRWPRPSGGGPAGELTLKSPLHPSVE